MEKYILFCGLLGLLTIGTEAQVPGFGRCPKPAVKSNFQLNNYTGSWYEIESTFLIIFQVGLKCVKATYSLNADGSIRVQNDGYNSMSNKETSIVGKAVVPDPSVPAKLAVNFPTSGRASTPTANYWVLDTDYENYSIVYSCTDLWLFHADIVWVLGRKKELEPALLEEIKGKLKSAGIRTGVLAKRDQSCDN